MTSYDQVTIVHMRRAYIGRPPSSSTVTDVHRPSITTVLFLKRLFRKRRNVKADDVMVPCRI